MDYTQTDYCPDYYGLLRRQPPELDNFFLFDKNTRVPRKLEMLRKKYAKVNVPFMHLSLSRLSLRYRLHAAVCGICDVV